MGVLTGFAALGLPTTGLGTTIAQKPNDTMTLRLDFWLLQNTRRLLWENLKPYDKKTQRHWFVSPVAF